MRVKTPKNGQYLSTTIRKNDHNCAVRFLLLWACGVVGKETKNFATSVTTGQSAISVFTICAVTKEPFLGRIPAKGGQSRTQGFLV